jgi:phosphate starvation-inducible PhoH-like protein
LELKIELQPDCPRLELFGASDKHLKLLRSILAVSIVYRGSEVLITGEEHAVVAAGDVFDRMLQRLTDRGTLSEVDVKELTEQTENLIEPLETDPIVVYAHKAAIEPHTKGQLRYIEAMRKNDLTFCTGPAGTGKTFLAVAIAVAMLKRNQIKKIVLARPAVEAGEKLGFLPGDMQAKVNPYLRPLFDSLEDMMDFSQMRKFMEMDIIEVVPLAFMRGRTLNEAVVICDEAQNTSSTQMLMFLTRLGRGSKMIVTGDVTQVDLEKGQKCGLTEAMQTLTGIKGIATLALDDGDIVRHKLVQNIVLAYEKRKQ